MKKEQLINGQRAILSLLIAIFSFITFTGCENPATPEDDASPLLEGTLPEGKGSFSLTLSKVGRTILPVTPNLNDFALYNLDFTPTNGGSAENAGRTNGTLATSPIFLDPGTYNLVVNAYKASNKTQLAAQGTLNNIVITAGNNTAASVTLEALVSGGTGAFRWEITLPAGVIANMTITPGNTGGTNQQTVTLSPPKATGSRTLNSGPYNVTFNLTKTDGKTVVWKELMYVYQSLESVFSFEFTDTHLSDSVYTVTFNSNGGEPGEWGQSVLHGAKVLTPAVPTKKWYALSGWYTDNNTFANLWDFDKPVIESFTLYAKWSLVPIESVIGLAEKLAWLQAHAQSDGNYILEVNADESIGPHTLTYSGRSNIGIILIGTGANQTVSLSSNGSMFTVDTGITLVMDNNVTLQGRSNNNASLVRVNTGSVLIMNVGAKIIGNNFTYGNGGDGGGVAVYDGTFTMNGGEITGNTGGGVAVYDGTFTMYDGEITGNTNVEGVRLRGTFTMEGGTISGNIIGVYVSNGTFTMNGGEITGNGLGVRAYSTFTMNSGEITGNATRGVAVNDGTFTMYDGEISGNTGGGVAVSGGIFAMEGGEISGNTVSATTSGNGSATSVGGGVYVEQDQGSYGTFTMNGGEISDNTTISSASGNGSATSLGGGVSVGYGCPFIMNGGTVSGNTASATSGTGSAESYGGGVSGSLTMTGGTISDNTATSSTSGDLSTSYGGGVYGSLTMTGGTISGNTATSFASGNNSATSYGGGVSGPLIMTSGTISGNTASSGGGVSIPFNSTFIMYDGKISSNTASGTGDCSGGGGVYVSGGGRFAMEGGEISGNTAFGTGNYSGGGGVYVSAGGNSGSGIFAMEGGEITGNTASGTGNYSGGGGVYVYLFSTFTMNDGTISGNTASGTGNYSGGGVYVNSSIFTKIGGSITGYVSSTVNGNVVKNSSGTVVNNRGHAVYATYFGVNGEDTSSIKRKETTAGPGVNLSWQPGYSTTWSGGWDY